MLSGPSKDVEDRRRRQMQNIEKARAGEKRSGGTSDLKKRASNTSLLADGSSYSTIQKLLGCSRHLIVRVKKEII